MRNPVISLNTAPDDILYLVLSQVAKSSPGTLRSVAQSSKRLRNTALPFTHRNLILEKGPQGSKELEVYQTLLNHFRNAPDVARHVRKITVHSDLPSEDLMLILNNISENGILHELHWNTSAHIPDAVLEKIHATWPDVKISVTVLDRGKATLPEHRYMDMKLLSSPLLTRLIYVVYNEGQFPGDTPDSDWYKLSQALLSGGSIQSLSIEHLRHYGDHHEIRSRPPRLELPAGSRLPHLENLHIRCEDYAWDTRYILALRDALDFSRIRSLDLGPRITRKFLETFTGMMPNLRDLKIYGDSEVERDFIDALPALESLRATLRAYAEPDTIWPAVEKHKATLKTLIISIEGVNSRDVFLENSLLEMLADSFPALEWLGWKVKFEAMVDAPPFRTLDVKLANYGFQANMDFLKIISRMNLRKLDIWMQIPSGDSEYSEETPKHSREGPALDRKGCATAAQRIVDAISQKQKDPIERLTVHVTRTWFDERLDPYEEGSVFQLRKNIFTPTGKTTYRFLGDMKWGLPYVPLSLEKKVFFEKDECRGMMLSGL